MDKKLGIANRNNHKSKLSLPQKNNINGGKSNCIKIRVINKKDSLNRLTFKKELLIVNN